MIENLIVGIIYLPMLLAPVILLFWYAFGPSSRNETIATATESRDESRK